MTYRYKRAAVGFILARKARCAVRSDRMTPYVHFDPYNTSTHTADKSSIRLIMSISAKRKQPRRHIDIVSAFTAEKYRHNKPVFVRKIPNFDGSLTYSDSPIMRMHLNLYGTKPAGRIYYDGLDSHLRLHGYQPKETDPCLYKKTTYNGSILSAVVREDFLVTEIFLTMKYIFNRAADR